MIIFKLEHDKALICTHCDLVHQFEHNADKLVFLIPDSIDGLDLTDCSAVLRYTLPDADHTDGTLPLTSEESAANSYLRFSTPIISALTTDVGDLQISLSIVDQSGTTALRSSYATVQITPAMGTYDMISPDDIGHLGFTTIGNLRENVEKILNDMSIGNMMPISPMSATTLGGAMADQAEDGDTQPVRIGTDQKLYTAQGVCLDSTLSKEDHAADAAEVGKRIRSLSEEITDCIKSPVSAQVGQTIVVKAVDAVGKPTEWETADVSSGGIDISRDPDLTIEVAEAVTQLSISEINGVPINTIEMVVLWEHPGGDAYIPNYFRFNNDVRNNTDATKALANWTFPANICPSSEKDAAILSRVKKVNDGVYIYEFFGLQQNPGAITGERNQSYRGVYRNILNGETSIKEFFVYQSKQIQPGCKVSVWVK